MGNTTTIRLGQPVERQQLAGSNRLFEIDISALAVPAWQANVFVEANALMRPTTGNQVGFVFQNSGSPGQTGNLEPAWPNTAGATVVDGSLTWTAVVPPVAGADSVQSVSWNLINEPDSALTVAGQTHDQLTASAYIGGGTSGYVYEISVTIATLLGAEYVVQIFLTVL